jgi:hypothetical protein
MDVAELGGVERMTRRLWQSSFSLAAVFTIAIAVASCSSASDPDNWQDLGVQLAKAEFFVIPATVPADSSLVVEVWATVDGADRVEHDHTSASSNDPDVFEISVYLHGWAWTGSGAVPPSTTTLWGELPKPPPHHPDSVLVILTQPDSTIERWVKVIE